MIRRPKKVVSRLKDAPRALRGRPPKDEPATHPVVIRIDEVRAKLKMSREAVSLAAGLSNSYIRDIDRKGTDPGLSRIAQIAAVLNEPPEFLAYGIRRSAITPEAWPVEMPVRGDVAAGNWREVHGQIDALPYSALPFGPDHRYPAEAQFGLVARGVSINRVAKDGDILLCVSIEAARTKGDEGDVVIVERAQGGRVEMTAKRIKYRDGHPLFFPDSDDPDWQTPFDEGDLAEDETIKVTALVIGVYRRLQRR